MVANLRNELIMIPPIGYTYSCLANQIKFNSILTAIMISGTLTLSSVINCEGHPTAKEKLSLVNEAVRGVAADAKLIFATGDDISLSGQTSEWIYNYKSEAKNQLYEYWYADGKVVSKSTISQWGEDLFISVGMNAIPETWIDSDAALSIAESNGGSAFRAAHGNNAAIRMNLLPSASGSSGNVPLLFSKTAWEISYRSQDNNFDIILNAQNGEIIKSGETTAKELLPDIHSLAKELASDAELFKIWAPGVNNEGKTGEWNYEFHSISQQITFMCICRLTRIRRDPATSPSGHNYSPSIELTGQWMDSDSALIIAEAEGGNLFRATHPGCNISISLTKNTCDFSKWEVQYISPSGSQSYTVFAENPKELNNTSIKQLVHVREMATGYANDAQLVFVTATGISYTGNGQWVYVFKSDSQQETYQFYVTPKGLICRSEEISSFFSEEDFLKCEPLPDSWIDIDSALIVTENSGGKEFRQAHPDWSISAYLLIGPVNEGFLWDIYYNSNTGGSKKYQVNAKIEIKVLARYLLSKADSLAKSIDTGTKLVYIHARNVDQEGNAAEWNYYYRSSDNQEIYQFYTDNGEICQAQEFSAAVNKEYLLGIDTIPDGWINSDYLISIAEQEGGSQFRQEHTDWDITTSLSLRDNFSQLHWRVMYRPGPEIFWVNAFYPLLSTEWPKTYGGEDSDIGLSVQETSDGGFIIAGNTHSFGAGMTDIWLIKTDENGQEMWSRTYGTEFEDFGGYVEENETQGFLIANTTTVATGLTSASFLTTDGGGNEGLRRGFETIGKSVAKSVHRTADKALIVAGSKSSGQSEPYDFWLFKTFEYSDYIWSNSFGGSGDDKAESMLITSDGGYIILGTTNSFGAGENDFWLVKTDNNGNKIWDKTFGGALNEEGRSLALTPDGGFILTGFTESYGEGGQDFYLIKTDRNGNKEWSKTFGSSQNDYANGVIVSSDGGYVLVGTTRQKGNDDIWVVKTDSTGNETRALSIGGEQADFGEAICETKEGDFVITGGTSSWGAGEMDVILVKVEKSGIVTQSVKLNTSNDILIQNYPNPFSGETTIRFNLNSSGYYKIRIVDLTGREINVLLNKFLIEGTHEIIWNSRANNGVLLNSGIYFVELSGNMKKQVCKIILIR